MRLPWLLVVLAPLSIAPVRADDPAPIVAKALSEIVVPRYAALADATAGQAREWRTFCAAPGEAGHDRLTSAFRLAADSWSAVEFVRYGPVEKDNRIDRMAHWPERQNAVGRAVSALVARTETEALAPDRFVGTSVAGQGFSALERLVHDTLTDGSEAARRRCAVGQAIAAALAANAGAILVDWRGPGSPLAKPWAPGAPAAREAATRLATELVAFLDTIADVKIGAPLGKEGVESARPQLAEGWRSGRSLQAIAVNLAGVETLTRALVDPDVTEGATALQALADARRLAESLEGPLGDQVEDPKRRLRLVLLKDQLKGTRDLVSTALTDRLGVTIGFNSRDGD